MDEKVIINDGCEIEYRGCLEVVNYTAWLQKYARNYHKYPLNRCKAYFISTGDIYALFSYDTLVAVYVKKSGRLYDILRVQYKHTNVSTRHISIFEKKIRSYYSPIQKFWFSKKAKNDWEYLLKKVTEDEG